ncbi:MAG: hypothetical protein QM784_02085 [Polyangiaceae bacterium]
MRLERKKQITIGGLVVLTGILGYYYWENGYRSGYGTTGAVVSFLLWPAYFAAGAWNGSDRVFARRIVKAALVPMLPILLTSLVQSWTIYPDSVFCMLSLLSGLLLSTFILRKPTVAKSITRPNVRRETE